MTSNRIPCVICESMILESTAQSNSGLCAQCARDPEEARHAAKIKKMSTDLGTPTAENYGTQLERFVFSAASSCVVRYGEEDLSAFLLYGIAHVDSPSVRAVSDYHVSMLSGDAWDDDGWGDFGEEIDTPQFEVLYRFYNEIEEGFSVWDVAQSVLLRLRNQGVLPDSTLICMVDEGMGHDELYSVASKFNSEETLQKHFSWLTQ